MSFKRLIARLDIKGSNVIKGIQMDGLRVVGPVGSVARSYYSQGVDELVMIDTVASLYGRESMIDLIRDVTIECFVPITVGGGVRSVADADSLFGAGADKVALNTAALSNPELIGAIAEKYGSQAVVVHVEAKRVENNWECYTQAGRERTGLRVLDWVLTAENEGAGELLVSSVDRDGTMSGIDIALMAEIQSLVSIPLVASSGTGTPQHMLEVFESVDVDGVAVGAALHWGKFTLSDFRAACASAKIRVRGVDS